VPGTGAIYDDPLFTMNYLNDFHLSDGSPCIAAGLDGFDIGALSYTLRAQAPTAISATPVGVTEDCDLSWTNPTHDTDGGVLASLDGVNVYRNGELLTTISPASPGEVMAYTDTVPYSDFCRYTVSAVSGGVEGMRSSHAELWVGGDVTGIMIWNLGVDKVNGEIVRDAILDRAYDDVIRLVERPDRYVLSEQVDAVFVLLGVYGWNHVLSVDEGQQLADYLDMGGNVFMEGSDTWYFDAPTPVHPYFSIDALADGTGDCLTVRGAVSTFTEGMEFSYTGNNSYIDHLAPMGTAFTILSNVTPAYDCGVAYDSGSYRTVGLSMDFAGLFEVPPDTTREVLMAAIIDFFGLTPTAVDTLEVGLTCSPNSGILPFNVQLDVSLENLIDQHRTMAAHFDVTLAAGNFYPNFRAGSVSLSPYETFSTGWLQNLPGLGTLVGDNLMTITGQDVTAAPYNQPPYAPSGDTAAAACTVTGIHP